MFGHGRAEDVVKEMLGVLDKLAVPVRLMLSLGMDGPNVNKSNAQDKPGQERERLSTIGQDPTQLPNSHMSQQFSERCGSVWIQC